MPLPDGRTICGAQNGSYTCQFDFTTGERHAGLHYAYYVTSGRARIAEWVDHFSQVTHRPAPQPAREPRKY